MTINKLGRRGFLKGAGTAALAAGLPGVAQAAPDVKGAHLTTPSGKPLRGLFPIMATPFTADDKLDTDLLAAEVNFINRGKVAGFIWPVFASSWSTLSDEERTTGAEAILAANKGKKAAAAIAVQNMQWDVDKSVRTAKHAAAHGADAIVAIPPNNGWNRTEDQIFDYYKTIGAATDLPLIVQTRGVMPVDLMIRMFNAIPTMKATKDEVGDPFARAPELQARTNNKLAIFAAGGGTGADLMKELPLGFEGLCPTPQYADILQQAMELYWAGKKAEAFSMWARVQAFASIPGATEYMMVARGVFKDTTKARQQPMEPEARQQQAAGETPGGAGAALTPPAGGGGAGGGGGGGARRGGGRGALTDAQKEAIRDAMNTYLKPYMKA